VSDALVLYRWWLEGVIVMMVVVCCKILIELVVACLRYYIVCKVPHAFTERSW